ncbi:ATP-binding protein [uncultured Algimonas sp.]|uniref:ATP-binding protein n=1 Tax=uncultured Algimonas sp. TaxID=1547920 RepID=UPI00263249D8|nr:ATP-binding protein [uncultured Algimonas sp.]
MTGVYKSEIDRIDSTPNKRLFWSIISDYNTLLALLELVDNAVDLATKNSSLSELRVSIDLDHQRQIVSITDNAGGVEHRDLGLLVTPGGSGHNPDEQVIGIFGVGSKRAGVALGEHIEIRTRKAEGPTLQIEVTKDWLLTDEWEVPVYQVDDIEASSTCITITRLRRILTDADIGYVREKLSETYAKYILQGVIIELNGTPIQSRQFSNWSYPPEHLPTKTEIELTDPEFGLVKTIITSGLIADRVPDKNNYGVYFYCNDRLIEKEHRSREVGYNNSQLAGVPHPDASLCRVIVEFNGAAGAMPWNSSKSQVMFDNYCLKKVQPTIIALCSRYSKVSRALKKTWNETVTPFCEGDVRSVKPEVLGSASQHIFPPLPRQRQNAFDRLLAQNAQLIDEEPWLRGLVEAMAFVDLVSRKRVSTNNRVALILLDSNFEIALKEFIVHRKDIFPKSEYDDVKLLNIFKNRSDVLLHVTNKICIPDELIVKAEHYYLLRNKLIHERTTAAITNTDVKDYRNVVAEMLNILHTLEV